MTNFLTLTTPINLDSEKIKFFDSAHYHPRFQYIWEDNVISYKTKNPQKFAFWSAIRSQDHTRITTLAKAIFGLKLDLATHKEALSIARESTPINHGTSAEFVYLLSKAFNIFNLDYQVEITPATGFFARPIPSQKKVLVSKEIHFEIMSMAGVVNHNWFISFVMKTKFIIKFHVVKYISLLKRVWLLGVRM